VPSILVGEAPWDYNEVNYQMIRSAIEMKIGIDFGTTRIEVAFVDRGNYPVVVFDGPDGGAYEWFPPLVAVREERRLYGWEAWGVQEENGWTVVRSLKRTLEGAGARTAVQIGDQNIPVLELLRSLAQALRTSLLEASTLPASGTEALEIMLGVPANANSNQRFLTAEAFRQAGFTVLGLLNEPSAASIDFGHRKRTVKEAKEKTHILVYDLGGGTFDASLVELDGREHVVIASEGIPALGGDDFDIIMADLALEAGGISATEQESLSQRQVFRLYEECRQKKEGLHPNTRNIAVDLAVVSLGWPQVVLPVSAFNDRCRPLVEETLRVTEHLLETCACKTADSKPQEQALDALYITGGGSELPLVGRMLRDVFGRRAHRSVHMRAATAIGLAIQADATAGYVLRDRFTRHFGVWREADAGRHVVFDPLFSKGTTLPALSGAPLHASRRYIPVHNIGHFRYLECSRLAEDGHPSGDVTNWDEIRFPFDPGLQGIRDLDHTEVVYSGRDGQREAEESYACDGSGVVTVTIRSLPDGYSRTYRVGQWAAPEPLVVPGRKKKAPPGKR
jgi:molecular chaperone DnaK